MCIHPCVYSQTILNPGDVAVVGYNFKDPDQFAFVFLRDVEAGTMLNITDCGYDLPTASFRTGEGVITYTVPVGGLETGSMVTYPEDAGFVTHGVSGFFGLTVDGDQLLFYQGPFTAPQFIYGLTVNEGGWQPNATSNNTSSLPPGLIDGNSALAQTKMSNGKLNCLGVAIDKDLFSTQIVDESRWERSNTTRYSLPDITCDYSVLKLPFEQNSLSNDEKENTIIEEGYVRIEVYSAIGQFVLNTEHLEQALIDINREKMYIFMVYYPDRLELHKILLE